MKFLSWKNIILSILILLILALGAIFSFAVFFDLNQLKPKIQEAVFAKTNRQLVIDGDIRLIVDFYPGIRITNVSFQNAVGTTNPYLFEAKTIELALVFVDLLKGRIVLNNLNIENAVVNLETDLLGRPNTKFKKNASEKPHSESTPKNMIFEWKKISKITLSDCKISYLKKGTNLNHTLVIKKSDISDIASTSNQALSITGSFNNEDFECTGMIGDYESIESLIDNWLVDLHIKTSDADFKLNGIIKNPIDIKKMNLNFTCQGTDINKTLHMIKKDVPLKDSFYISGQIIQEEPHKILIKDLTQKTSYGESTGNIYIDLTESIPTIKADLVFQTINLPNNNNNSKDNNAEKKNLETDLLIPDIAIPTDFFGKCRLNVNLEIKKLLLKNFAFDNIILHIELFEEYFIIKPLTAKIGDNDINCRFSLKRVDGATRLISIVEFHNLEIAKIINNLDFTDKVSGQLDCEVKLRTKGNSTREWFNNMEGKIRLMGEQGTIDYQLINYLGNDLAAGLFDLLNPFKKKEDIDVNCFVSSFDIYNGMSKMTVFVLDTSQMTVIGEGEIILNNEELDFDFKSLPKKGMNAGTFAKINISAAELIEPFKISGTLKKPELGVNLIQTGLKVGQMVGGIMLFGPAGIAAILINADSVDENPCLTAVEKAQQGVNTSKDENKGSLSDMYERENNIISDVYTDIIDQLQF